MPGMDAYTLYGQRGSGSMIVEAALALAGAPVSHVEVSWDDLGWHSGTLKELNPLGQLPTLITPDGQVLTESAAMMLHLADRFPEAGLVPPADHPQRAVFQRWLIFLVAAVYPTFTYGDVPERWVEGDEAAAAKLRAGTDSHREVLWRYLETVAGEPWFLGDTFSALDLYVWQMRWWRPGREWFAAETPRIDAIGRRADALPPVSRVQQRNFPKQAD
jgi:GST-like protein